MINSAWTVVFTAFVSSLLAAPAAKDTQIPVELQAAIEAARNAVEPYGAGFKASNPKQNLELRFERTAASVRLPDAEVRLRLAGYGRGGPLAQPEAATLTAAGNRVEYRRGSLTEWYLNDRLGLEQGFTLAERPAGDGALVLALVVEGGLTPRLKSTDVVLLERQGAAVLRYEGLKAWDAHGRTLAARMDVRGAEVRLSVEDAGAPYPVTIDPWLQAVKLSASDGAIGDRFGSSVAVSGDTALVGASAKSGYTGAAYVYVRSGTAWTEQARLTASDGAVNDGFGRSVAVSGDTALVGAYGNACSGAVYVYVRSGTVWTEQARLTASDGACRDLFGASVALSGDTALVGAFGRLSGAGAAYVYLRSGTVWTEQTRLTAPDGIVGDAFGYSVALSADTALVGAYEKATYTGAAYVYVRNGSVWTGQAKLTASDGAAYDYFGISVAVSTDTAIVGAFCKSNCTGAAYVYARSGTTWTQQARLTAADGVANDHLGVSVALSGDTALVGAHCRANCTGAAYVYVRSGKTWTERSRTTASDGAVGDFFGASVALSGGTALVGASYKANATGAAYVYAYLPTTANLTISPCAGSPFTTLTLAGSGFSPNETVHFAYISTSTVQLGTGNADSSGEFTETVRSPVAPYGTGYIRAIGQSSGLSGAANFSVTPRLMMNPNTGSVGCGVLAQGFGFSAGEAVDLYWYTAPRKYLGTVAADSTGSFYQGTGLTFTIPAGVPTGTNAVVGVGQTSQAIGTGYVTLQ